MRLVIERSEPGCIFYCGTSGAVATMLCQHQSEFNEPPPAIIEEEEERELTFCEKIKLFFGA